jgi:hypothetical protein
MTVAFNQPPTTGQKQALVTTFVKLTEDNYKGLQMQCVPEALGAGNTELEIILTCQGVYQGPLVKEFHPPSFQDVTESFEQIMPGIVNRELSTPPRVSAVMVNSDTESDSSETSSTITIVAASGGALIGVGAIVAYGKAMAGSSTTTGIDGLDDQQVNIDFFRNPAMVQNQAPYTAEME